MRLLLSKQEWLFRLLNPFLCVVKLKLLLEAVIDSRFALADLVVLYTFEEQTPFLFSGSYFILRDSPPEDSGRIGCVLGDPSVCRLWVSS